MSRGYFILEHHPIPFQPQRPENTKRRRQPNSLPFFSDTNTLPCKEKLTHRTMGYPVKVNKKIIPFQEDRLLLKESRTNGFSVSLMFRKLRYSPPTDFPWRSIWNPIVPPKLGFFAWKASWGKVLTLDQLKRKGIPLVNRCSLCEENEETIDHLLIHCSRAKLLWDLLLAITNLHWVFPCTVRQLLLAWQSANIGKKRKRVWMAAPLCIFWTLWMERNRVVFENEVPSAHRMKSFFLFSLWSWAKLYSVDNVNSLVDFLTLMGFW